MLVRNINTEDVEPLIELGRHMHAQSPVFRPYPFHPHVLRSWFFAAIEKPDTFFCAVATEDKEIAGAILACASPMIFSETRMSAELGFFVYEKYRGSRAAFALVNSFQEWSKKQNCVTMDTGVFAGIDNDKAIRFYERMGYEKLGMMMRKELEHGQG